MFIILIILYPLLEMYLHRWAFKCNPGLYIDLYIPKEFRDIVWEALKNEKYN